MKKTAGGEDRLIGMQFGDYRLQRLLATGGMARIYEAADLKLNRLVAVKLLNLEGNPDTTLAHRFQREARAVARLDHDHIITIYQYGEALGFCYIAMKLVDGKDLAQEMARLRRSGQKMEPGRALGILEQVAAALDYAHMNNIVHRDIKPSNVLIDKYDQAVLTDFGLLLQSSEDATKTRGTAFGTPRYIAPEQALASASAVPQSDIYALAVILYEILTGEAPFSGETPMEIAMGHIGEPPRPPRSINPKIPVGVERELLRALEKEPSRRHNSASDFINAVKTAYLREQPEALKFTPVIAKINEPRVTTKPTKAKALDGSTSELAANERPVTPPVERRRRRVSPLLIALIGGLLLLGVWWVISMVNATPDGTITLIYDEQSMIMQNSSADNLNVFKLQFVRGIDGSGNDDYSGDRVDGDMIPARSCYLLELQNAQVSLPNGCRLHNYEVLQNPQRFFWRREPVDAPYFEVWYDRQVLTRCTTVSDGGSQTCSFVVPMATETP